MMELLRELAETDRKLNLLLDREMKERDTDLNLSPDMWDLSDEEINSLDVKHMLEPQLQLLTKVRMRVQGLRGQMIVLYGKRQRGGLSVFSAW